MPAGAENRASDRKSRKCHANGISTKGSTPEAVSFLIDSVAFLRNRGVAQPGRALPSGGRGRKFKSSHPDQYFQTVTLNFIRVLSTILDL